MTCGLPCFRAGLCFWRWAPGWRWASRAAVGGHFAIVLVALYAVWGMTASKGFRSLGAAALAACLVSTARRTVDVRRCLVLLGEFLAEDAGVTQASVSMVRVLAALALSVCRESWRRYLDRVAGSCSLCSRSRGSRPVSERHCVTRRPANPLGSLRAGVPVRPLACGGW